MYFLYKTKDGKVGKVRDINLLPDELGKLIVKDYDGVTGKVDKVHISPRDIDVLIVKDYDGSSLELPQCNKLVLDLNHKHITYIYFNTDVLSVYRSPSGWFRFETCGSFRRLKHLDMRCITSMDRALMYIPVTEMCELDYKNVKNSDQLFYGSHLKSIPPMRNYWHLDSDIFRCSNIPIHKERAWYKLMEINKQRYS